MGNTSDCVPLKKADPLPQEVLFLTGLPGAGRTSCLNILEDMGYMTINNIPLSYVEPLVYDQDICAQPLALGLDAAHPGFTATKAIDLLERLEKDPAIHTKLVFLDCSDEVLANRYNETRRRFPTSQSAPLTLHESLALTRTLLVPLLVRATTRLDTTTYTLGQLKQALSEIALVGERRHEQMDVVITSFGFRHGLPKEADLLFDVRFLKNPHYDGQLRHLTGQDAKVGDYVQSDPDWNTFFGKLTDLLDLLVPRYRQEGKTSLTIAIGCTGGHHRSIFTAGQLARWLEERFYIKPHLLHRDIRN